jgi:hypothetical protein
MLSIVPLLLLGPLAPTAPMTSANLLLDSPARHIRTTNSYVWKLLKSGYARSPSFARLVSHLHTSDLYVQIEIVPQLPPALEGRLIHLARAHQVRYVRIQIALRGSAEDMIALLGHELQHATEVADAVGADDAAGLVALYQRIGMQHGEQQYDTVAAEEMGRTVRRELLSMPNA